MNNKDVLTVVKRRRTTKSYLPKKISKTDLTTIMEAIKWAPSSMGSEPYRVLVLEDNKLKEQAKDACWGQPAVAQCSHLFIFLSRNEKGVANEKWFKERFVRSKGYRKEEPTEESYKEFKTFFFKEFMPAYGGETQWAMKQAYIALGMAMMAAAALDLDSTPMEGYEEKALQKLLVSKKLMDPKMEKIAVMMAVGYKNTKDPHVVYPTSRDENSIKFKLI